MLFVCVPHIKELWVMCSMGEDYDVSKLIRFVIIRFLDVSN